MKIKVKYVEPAEYIPKELRKKYKLGEYAEKTVEADIKVTVETKDGTLKAEGIDGVQNLLKSIDKKKGK